MSTTTITAAANPFAPGAATIDAIASVKLSSIVLPLSNPISDAKVLTGRQKPMTEVVFLFAEIAPRTATKGSGSATPSAPAAPPNSPTPRRSPPS